MLNHIDLMGRATRDPELRYTQSQTPVCTFTVAVDRDFGSEKKETDFISVVAWKQTAEFVNRYIGKGALIAVSGRLQMREYIDKDGNKRTAAEVVADRVYFGESKHKDESFTPAGNGVNAGPVAFSELSDTDGELPF